MTTTDPVADRVGATLLAQVEAAALVLGDRLGFWAALAPAALTSDQAAQAVGVAPRYAREWCEAMATSGYLVHDDGRFRVAPDAVPVLVDRDSPTYLMPLLRQMAAATAALRRLEEVYRSGGGFGWAEYDVDMRVGQGDGNAVTLRSDLPRWVAEHLPEVATRLRGTGARIADVGCGHGWASVGLGCVFPDVRIDAFDPDPSSVDAARRHTDGLPVTVHERSVGPGDGPYDLIVMVEMLHDVPDPVGLLHTAAQVLAPDGVVFVADMAAADALQTPGDEIERLLYGYSLLVCLPDSLATPGSVGTGTVMRRGTFTRYVEAAGLRIQRELPVEHDIWRFSVLERAR